MTRRPPPPVPADADLRDFPDMPLDVARLRDSDGVFEMKAEAFRCAVLLWAASWHQVPAGSVPSDERAQSRLAGMGGNLRAWRRVREEAMRGFVRCSDDRFYHEVVVEKVLNAISRRRKAKSAALSRWRSERAEMPSRGAQDVENTETTGPPSIPPSNAAEHGPSICSSDALEGKGREGKGITAQQQPSVLTSARKPWLDVGKRLLALLEEHNPAWATRNAGPVRQWLADGADPEAHIFPTVERMIAKGTASKATSLRYFTSAVMEVARENPIEPEPEDADSDAYRAMELAVKVGDIDAGKAIHKARKAGRTDEANRLGREYLDRTRGEAKTA